MKLSGWARLWIAALPLAGCAPSDRDGWYSYGCYSGPLIESLVDVRWSEKGHRADTTIGGRQYVFRFESADLMKDTFKDQSGALLTIDPELIFTPASGDERSVCNPGQKLFRQPSP